MRLRKLVEEFSDMVKYKPAIGYGKSEPLEMEIYKNPTSKEFKGLGVKSVDNIRCILKMNGDLYTTNNQNEIIHNDILKLIGYKERMDWNKKPEYLDKFICLYRLPNGEYRLSTMYTEVVKKTFYKKYYDKYKEANSKVNIDKEDT